MLEDKRLSFKTVEMNHLLRDQYLLKAARSMTVSIWSGMNRALNYYQVIAQDRIVKAKGIFAFYQPPIGEGCLSCSRPCIDLVSSQECPVGWAMLTYENDGAHFYQKSGQACIHIYVREASRRQGIGSKLMRMAEQAKEVETILNVYVYDAPTFFAPYVQSNNFQSVYGE